MVLIVIVQFPIWPWSKRKRDKCFHYSGLNFCLLSFICLKGREGERQKDKRRVIFIQWVTSSMPTISIWAGPKPGAQHPIQISHLSGRNPNSWAISHWLPRCTLAETRLEVKQLGLNLAFGYGMQASQMKLKVWCQTPTLFHNSYQKGRNKALLKRSEDFSITGF